MIQIFIQMLFTYCVGAVHLQFFINIFAVLLEVVFPIEERICSPRLRGTH